jgi:predicted nucleic-acid-binding protein
MIPALLDANVLLRFLTRDDPEKAEDCRQLLLQAARENDSLLVTSLVFAELVWVLEKVYKWERLAIAPVLTKLLALPGLNIPEKKILKQALETYCEAGIDFIDAYQAAVALANGITQIYSYDRHFDRLQAPIRLEPGHVAGEVDG